MQGKKTHDWEQLQSDWAHSGQTLRDFLKVRGIPYATGQRYIHAREKDSYLARADRPSDKFTDRLTKELMPKLASGNHAEFLGGIEAMLKEVLVESHGAFLDKIAKRENVRPAEMARVTLSTIDQLRAIRDARDGIPDVGERCEWPITRDFDPHWYQRDFVFDFPSNLLRTRGVSAFIFAYIAGVGSGKTRCGAEKWGKVCELNRGLPHGVYAPTYRMLEDVTKREFIEACARKGIPFINRPSEDKVILWGDTDVLFRSMENPDRLRGPNLAAAWIDEGSQVTTREAFDVIAGRIRHPDAKEPCIIFTSTPAGFNWAYDVLVVDGSKNRVKMYTGSTRDNVSVRKGYYESLLELYDEKLADQELEGKFVDIGTGRAYYNFDRKVNVLPAAQVLYNPNVRLILMCDFNVKPMHWVIGQSYTNNGIERSYMLDEIYLDQSTSTEETALEFVERYGKHVHGIAVYGDAAGQYKQSTAATRTDYEIMKQVFEAKGVLFVDFHIGKSNPLHSERVQDVNARFRDAKGVVHLYISDRCEQLIQDFERQGFIEGTKQLDKTDKKRGHGSDGVGYYINREHSIRRIVAKTSRR